MIVNQIWFRSNEINYLDDEHGYEQNGTEWGQFNGLESKEIRRVFIRKVIKSKILMFLFSIQQLI